MAAQTIPEPDALLLCSVKKQAILADEWTSSGPSTFELGGGVVCDPPRRGLVVEICTTHGTKAQWRKTDFGLWDKLGGRKEHVRVYQLTIAPAHLLTHIEDGVVWRGSHEHVGAKAYLLPDMSAASFDDALEYFCQRTNISLADPISDPFLFHSLR